MRPFRTYAHVCYLYILWILVVLLQYVVCVVNELCYSEAAATLVRKRSITALPLRRLFSDIRSFRRWAESELWPIGKWKAGQLNCFSKKGTEGIDPPSLIRNG